jgi:hypothetical protein
MLVAVWRCGLIRRVGKILGKGNVVLLDKPPVLVLNSLSHVFDPMLKTKAEVGDNALHPADSRCMGVFIWR